MKSENKPGDLQLEKCEWVCRAIFQREPVLLSMRHCILSEHTENIYLKKNKGEKKKKSGTT